LEDIEPWGSDGRKTLHWFGLTDGFYRVTIGGKELFEYDASLFQQLGWRPGQRPEGFEHAAEYQVARLFHDLSEVAPVVEGDLVPQRVARRLATPGNREVWRSRVRDAAERDENPDVLDTATGWLDERSLDSGHLRAGPLLRLWRSDAGVHAWCDNRGRELKGRRVWANDELYVVTPVEQFHDAVTAFRTELLAAMEARVRVTEAGWRRDGVEIDVGALRDQQARETASPWATTLDGVTNWDEVDAALEALERPTPTAIANNR